MSGIRNHNLDKPFPGCLGKMVNMFDFTSGIAGNGLLTDKQHGDGSPPRARRSLPDVSRLNQLGDQMQNKMMASESARNCSKKKSNATPMKMLIAQEMSKEQDSRSNPPSVVAKLMGLDTLPQGKPSLAIQRSHSKASSRSNSDLPLNCWNQDKGYWDLQVKPDNDVSEITRQPQKPNCIREKSPHKARFDEQSNDKMMAVVRQKFIEAKRLSTDEKLRQSPEFDDALEVLNSNKELFLKLLQESNSMYFQHLHEHSVSAQHEMEKITVIKPCKIFDDAKVAVLPKKNEKQTKKGTLVSEAILPQENHSVGRKTDENRVQRTQIVVLKPSSGKPQEIEAVVSSPSLSSGVFCNPELVEETEDAEGKKTREFTKEITWKMCENLSSHRKDEELLSSVFSNDYTGDESSFYKSEKDYAAGNLSDVEIKSPASRHSWDYANRFDSPYTMSSFTRTSCSPESSVCREAKKRLSERWATMTSMENSQDQRPVRTRASTLGEMLALSNIKNTTVLVNKDNTVDSKDSTSPIGGCSNKDKDIDKLHRRSKSAPVSFTVSGTNVDNLSEGNKTNILHETSKGENVKASFKGKVSSLFFLRSKKSNKGKPTASQSKDEPSPPETPFVSCEIAYNSTTQYLNDSGNEECSSAAGSLGHAASPEMSAKPCVITSGIGLHVTDPLTCGNAVESHEQPSPISVLEILSEEDGYTTTESSRNDNPECGTHSKCILIDKSPPIESIASTLSWDDSSVDTATSYPSQTSLSYEAAEEEEEREYFSFVETLLSVAGLNGEIQPDMFMARWYSFESPIDPSYRDKYIDLNEKEAPQEAKRRHIKSTSKLVFDCVNAALVEMAGYGSETCRRAIPYTKPHKNVAQGSSLTMVNQVWSHMNEWSSGEESYFKDDFDDGNNLMVESIVMKEVLGKGWMEHLRSEMDNIGLGIQRVLLEDLLQETLVEYAVKT